MTNGVNRTGWTFLAVALLSFAAGSLTTARLMRVSPVRAETNRVFDLRVYHAVPGKVPKLVDRFRDAAPLFKKHNLEVLGYWVPEDPKFAETFVYLLAHPSREEAKKRWEAFHADPAFQKYLKEEDAEQLIEKVDWTYMHPTDFSDLR